MREACETVGFFGVTGIGALQPAIARASVEGKAFFESPHESKMSVAAHSSAYGDRLPVSRCYVCKLNPMQGDFPDPKFPVP